MRTHQNRATADVVMREIVTKQREGVMTLRANTLNDRF